MNEFKYQLDISKLTTSERKKCIIRLNQYKDMFGKSIEQYSDKKRSKEAAEKTLERLQKYYGFLTNILKKCNSEDIISEDIISMDIFALAYKAWIPAGGVVGEIMGTLKGQNKSNQEINTHLMLMLQTTINMLEQLNVGEEEISNALKGTVMAIQDIKDRYGDELDEDTFAKLVQDECADRILRDIKPDADFVKCKSQIIENIGLSAWNKMSEVSQTFIVNAMVMFVKLSEYDNFDYSAVCLTASKALEVEVTKRYFSGYLKYLKDKSVSSYPTGVLNRKSEELSPDEFMLGGITDITGYAVVNNDAGEVILLNKYRNDNGLFLEYAENALISKDKNHLAIDIVKKHVFAINKVRSEYRNPAAHKKLMSESAAKECLDYLVNIQRTLGMIIDDCCF